MTFYCSADGVGPADPVDWSTRTDEERISCVSHVVRNGSFPITATKSSYEVVCGLTSGLLELYSEGTPDEHGGLPVCARRGPEDAGEALLCPECSAPVRAS